MVSVVDYGMGNIGSIVNMLKRLGVATRLASTPDQINAAGKLILPGVGAFDNGMVKLRAKGLVGALNAAVQERKIPILGICLGMQLFSRRSEEGQEPGLAWIPADTIRFRPNSSDQGMKVPHMGWSSVEINATDPVFGSLPLCPRFYFVHSYYLKCDDAGDVVGWATHGHQFAAAVRRGNIWATQFHPEKSHKFGLALLANFSKQV